MQKSKIFNMPISFLITLTLVFQAFGGMVLPGTTVRAAGPDIYSTSANQTLDPSDPLDVVLTKPYRGSTVTKSGATGTITIELPYGTFYQMLHPVVNPGSTVKVYKSGGTEIVSLTGINNGDYELGLKDSQGNRVVPGWTGGTYFLDVTNGPNTRRYTITVTIQPISDFKITRSLQGGGTEAVNKPGQLVAPMNIRANENGMDTWGSTYIGYGDTGLNSLEGPMRPSSYSGKNWYDSFWGSDIYVHTTNDVNKFKPAGVSNDLPKDGRGIPLRWYGDNMYVQTIAKDNSDGRIDAYGVDVKYDGTMTASGKISGFDKLQSDIIRIHKFDAPVNAPGHEDGDRGAASSTTQRLEMKTNYTPENVVANDGPGTISTHFWRLLVPSETVKRQKKVGSNNIGTWSPNNYGFIYQIKEAKGNANGSPTVDIALNNGNLSFDHSRNNSTPSGMQSAGGINTGTFLTLTSDKFVDRWIDIELTTETADFGHLYVRVTDTDTGALLGEGTLNEADLLRRNIELQLPTPLPAPAPGPVYREGNYNTLKDDQGRNVNFGRSKWGIYGAFPATGTGREEWQPSTIYMADITIIKRDRDTYVFPNGYKPTDRDSNLRIMGWEHQNQMKVPLGTKITDLTLKTKLDVTLSNGFTVKVPVKWDTSGYSPTVPGIYRILGELQPPGGITIPAAPDNYYPDYYKPYFEINNSTVHDWGKAVMGANIKIVSHNEESRKENVLEEDRTAMTTSEGYAFFQSGSSFELDAGRTPWRYWVALDLGRQIDISRIEIEFGTMGSPGRSRNSSAWWTNDAAAYESLIESYNKFYDPTDPALAAGQPEPNRQYYLANNWPTKNPFGVENLVNYSGPWKYFEGSGRQPSNVNSQGTSTASNWKPTTQPALKGGTLGTNYTLGRRATDVLAGNGGQPITARYVMVVNELNFFSSVTGAPGTVGGSSPGPMQFLDFAVIGELHDDLTDLMVLETLTVGGVSVTGFDPSTKNYTVNVAANYPIPTVAATLSPASIAAGAVVDIIQATDVEKTAVVRISRTGGKDVFYLVKLNKVPPGPTGLSAQAGNAQVGLSWNTVTGATYTYNVKRSLSATGPFSTIASSVTQATYTDKSVANGTTYYYVVTALNQGQETANSAIASAKPEAPGPTGLTAQAGNAQVGLSWNTVTGATYTYNVKRSLSATGPFTTIASSLTQVTYTDKSVANGTTYYYVVTALNQGQESANSATASAKPEAPVVPPAPTGLTAQAGNAQVGLSWNTVTGATYTYNVKRSLTESGPFTIVATNVTGSSFTDNSVANGTTYYYVVSAVNAGVESANSSVVVAVIPLHRSSSSSSGGTPTDSGKNEQKVTTINPSEWQKAIDASNSAADTPKIKLEASGTESSAQVQLTASLLADAQSKLPTAVLSVHFDNVTYDLPIKALNLDAIANSLGAAVKDIKINVQIEKVTGTTATAIENKAKQAGLTPLTGALAFNITAEAGNKTISVNEFGTIYVSRSIVIGKSVDVSKATAVMYNPVTGEMRFVPAVFSGSGTNTQVTIQRPGNSIYMVVDSNKTFTDLDGHWAKDDVELLASKLLIQGITDTGFAPNNQITRAEFAALLVRAMGLSEDSESKFSDVKSTDWFAGSVNAAAKAGLIDGFEGGVFKPASYITREQMAVMISRSLSLAGKHPEGDVKGLFTFADSQMIGTWAKDAVSQSVNAKIINGMTDQTFAPNENSSRAQAAVMLKRLLKYTGFIN
ncbi:S-layer homology domain-containing protein [Paenibacillus radicis (ex Xue et al. 2023)]|uniref:S-layer homology domain-containing protein n=1 Tax=Paenibacillus radicis (ex Xue et al. 2023) TaxID=2972489 RepID=A0ABT1YTY5_9BACL|nr:S-layer homology domain-containing protein [Paenibacillus radicis (ex Xue et al. 2023)]MCR8636639.1 S-layer homology domain-containing protein [Paenibacillus radicis (ex Xue et al. 2023)]